MDYISNIQHQDNETSFSFNNINNSLVNALRRIIISELNTVGFRYQENSTDIKIINNTTKFHNEYIAHRISMIPIHGANSSSFDINKYKFVVNKKNTSTNKMYVTSEDFEVYEQDEQQKWILNKEKAKQFFRPNKISGDYILICLLKESSLEEGQELHLECKASISNGLENIHYSPVSKCVLFNKVDDNLRQQKLEELLVGKDPDDIEKITKNFNYLDSERCFKKDQDGDPYEFTFSLENIGTLSNKNIFDDSIHLLINKIELFNSKIQEDKLEMSFSKEIEFKAVDIIIQEETHTLGNLIQYYLYKYFVLEQKRISFVGYDKKHPLDNYIILRISFDNDKDFDLPEYKENIKEVIEVTTQNVINILNEIQKEWNQKFKVNKKISIKKKEES